VILILFFGLVNFANVAIHDVPLALFHISCEGESTNLKVNFDLVDFSNTYNIETADLDVKIVQRLVNQNTSFKFNNLSTNVLISDVQIIEDHLRVYGRFDYQGPDIINIEIDNTFLTSIENHSNIIQIDMNKRSRDFRMHKGRTSISITY